MQINTLKRKNPNAKSKRVARGGSRGKTAGRGHKGQKARAGHRMRPELRDIIKKLPKMRGRGKNLNTSIKDKPAVVNLAQIEKAYQAGEKISPKTLVAKGLVSKVSGKYPPVKILGQGSLSKKLSVENCLMSDTVKEIIEKGAGASK